MWLKFKRQTFCVLWLGTRLLEFDASLLNTAYNKIIHKHLQSTQVCNSQLFWSSIILSFILSMNSKLINYDSVPVLVLPISNEMQKKMFVFQSESNCCVIQHKDHQSTFIEYFRNRTILPAEELKLWAFGQFSFSFFFFFFSLSPSLIYEYGPNHQKDFITIRRKVQIIYRELQIAWNTVKSSSGENLSNYITENLICLKKYFQKMRRKM